MSRRAWTSRVAVAAALLVGGRASGSARLEYQGLVLSARQVEALAGKALAAPGDSVEISRLLGTVVSQLENQGYLDARAWAKWDTTRLERLRIAVTEGVRYRLISVAMRAPSAEDSARLMHALALPPGEWASPGAISEALDHALREVVDHGYPYAALAVRSWEVDSAGLKLEHSGALG